jgi:phage recombination protein Bet
MDQKHLEENSDLIKNTVAVGATDSELKTFLYLSKEYGLDPLKKEIYFIKYGGKSTIITSRDGYLKIANRHEQFNGLESDVVYQGDKLIKREDGSLLIEYGESHLNFDKSKLTGAFCNVFRKDRSKAITVFVSIKDYYKRGAPIWEQYINAMILKVAESMALKRAFVISGLVTQEEIEKEELVNINELSLEVPATGAQKKALSTIINTKQISEETLRALLSKHTDKSNIKDLNKEEASTFIATLNALN